MIPITDLVPLFAFTHRLADWIQKILSVLIDDHNHYLLSLKKLVKTGEIKQTDSSVVEQGQGGGIAFLLAKLLQFTCLPVLNQKISVQENWVFQGLLTAHFCRSGTKFLNSFTNQKFNFTLTPKYTKY